MLQFGCGCRLSPREPHEKILVFFLQQIPVALKLMGIQLRQALFGERYQQKIKLEHASPAVPVHPFKVGRTEVHFGIQWGGSIICDNLKTSY